MRKNAEVSFYYKNATDIEPMIWYFFKVDWWNSIFFLKIRIVANMALRIAKHSTCPILRCLVTIIARKKTRSMT